LVNRLAITSRYTWLYGKYPFTNDPSDGKPRHFFDEVRCKDLVLGKGDVVRLQKISDKAAYCVIDFVDLEDVAPPLKAPAHSLSAADFGAKGDGITDDTDALRRCLAEATKQRKTAFVPAGDYKLTGDLDFLDGAALQGAGMWHTTFVGDEALYDDPNRRLRFRVMGAHCRLADFAFVGKLKYRNDQERNDGIFGAHATNAVISRLWIEHTKVGMWFYVSKAVRIDACRLRNTLADGINFCLDVRDSTVEDTTARNTGDDCFAIWPTVGDQGFMQETPHPGNNVFHHCTGELPFLANGGAIYGGRDNRIEDCLFRDISAGSGVLLSTTFPTSDGAIDNNFSGTTVVKNCTLSRCGGYDHDWAWRGALEICIDRKSISGVTISDTRIEDSISDGVRIRQIVSPVERSLDNARMENVCALDFAVGTSPGHGLEIDQAARGSMSVVRCHFTDVRNNASDFRLIEN